MIFRLQVPTVTNNANEPVQTKPRDPIEQRTTSGVVFLDILVTAYLIGSMTGGAVIGEVNGDSRGENNHLSAEVIRGERLISTG